MNDTPDPCPSHERSLLPPWFPGWLLACLLTGVAFAVGGGFLVKNWEWRTLAIGFALGFGVLLIVLSMIRPREQDVGSTLLPPVWVRMPVSAAVVVVLAYFWTEDKLRQPPPAGLEAKVAVWILLVGLSWFALRLLWMGWEVLRAVGAGGQH